MDISFAIWHHCSKLEILGSLKNSQNPLIGFISMSLYMLWFCNNKLPQFTASNTTVPVPCSCSQVRLWPIGKRTLHPHLSWAHNHLFAAAATDLHLGCAPAKPSGLCGDPNCPEAGPVCRATWSEAGCSRCLHRCCWTRAVWAPCCLVHLCSHQSTARNLPMVTAELNKMIDWTGLTPKKSTLVLS